MTFGEFLKREKYIVVYAQTKRFRFFKWIIILILAFVLYKWQGIKTVAVVFACLGFLGILLHFFLRYKTNAWTKSWGPYKKIWPKQ